MRLARMLHMSVARAQQEIDSREFSDWCTFMRIEHDPEDVRIARICALMARLSGNKNVTVEQFLPQRIRRQSVAEIEARLRIFSNAHNGRLAKDRKRAKRGN